MRPQSLADEVMFGVVRWLVYENAGRGGVLPPLYRIMRHFAASRSTCRDALQRLEVLGVLDTRRGSQIRVNPSNLATSPDLLWILFHAADDVNQKIDVVRTWLGLKWLVAFEAYPHVPRLSERHQGRIQDAIAEFTMLARPGEDPTAIVDMELHALWTIVAALGRIELKAILAPLIRTTPRFSEVWSTLIDPSALRDDAVAVYRAVTQDEEAVRAALVKWRSREMTDLKDLVRHAERLSRRHHAGESALDDQERAVAGDEITTPCGSPFKEEPG